MLSAQDLAALATAGAIIVGGAWAAFEYRGARRSASAQWVASLYRDFYLDSRLARERRRVEDLYPSEIRPQVQQWIVGTRDTVEPRPWEAEGEQSLDVVLNFLELVAYLEQRGELSKDDIDSLFDYWVKWVGSSSRPELRLYLSLFGYEGLCRLVERTLPSAGKASVPGQLEDASLLAVYGSLVPGGRTWDDFVAFAREHGQADIASRLDVVGTGTVTGTLHDLGSYPGIVRGRDSVRVTLIRVAHSADLALLDEYEEFDPASPQISEYVREFWPVDVEGGAIGAWVYVYRYPIPADSVVDHGDWEAHLVSRDS